MAIIILIINNNHGKYFFYSCLSVSIPLASVNLLLLFRFASILPDHNLLTFLSVSLTLFGLVFVPYMHLSLRFFPLSVFLFSV